MADSIADPFYDNASQAHTVRYLQPPLVLVL